MLTVQVPLKGKRTLVKQKEDKHKTDCEFVINEKFNSYRKGTTYGC